MHSKIAIGHEEKKVTVIFVHGLSGSASNTWGKMGSCLREDEDLKQFKIDYYTYPTRLLRLPFTPPLPGLRDLSDGLRTFLEENCSDQSPIYMVAHSLGGLIARDMVVSAIRSGAQLNVKKLALIAVPNSGASLANVGSKISFRHRQLKALCKDSQALSDLNIEWEQLNVENTIDVRYVLGGCDRVVPSDSALPFIGGNNRSILINADHRTIVCPNDRDDIRYKTIRRFLLGRTEQNLPAEPNLGVSAGQRPDPLFEVYTPKSDAYYLIRSFDNVLGEVISNAHVWLSGESGIGKSAAARRAVHSSGWKLFHINLSGHPLGSPADLFGSLVSELRELAGMAPPKAKQTFDQEMVDAKKAVLALCSHKVTALVVEEMPIKEGDLVEAARVFGGFLDLLDGDDRLYGQVRVLFSSRRVVAHPSQRLTSKVREKIQFLPVETWSDNDIERLIKLLTAAIRPSLSEVAQAIIVSKANGSPRFVKMLFRHWRNQTAGGKSVEDLCAQVAREAV